MTTSAAIVGAGAIGAWLADALDRAGWRVSMVARGATLAAVRTAGLKVGQGGELRISRPSVGAPSDLGIHDFVILTVKAQILSVLAPTLKPLIGPSTIIVSGTNGIPWWFFQNFGGPIADRTLQSVDPGGSQALVFPQDRTLGSVVHASVRVESPGHVQVVAADRLILGAPGGLDAANGALAVQLDFLVQALRAGRTNAQVSNDIRRDVWTKLWGNMTMNPLSALTRRGTSTLLANADVRELCIRMMQEMQLCAQRLNLAVAITPEERIGVTQRLGDFKTSMLADIEAGRPLEIDPQLGAVVEIAGLLDIPTPFLRAVLGLTRLASPAIESA